MRKALKAIFYAGVAALAVMFVLSLLGIIDNNRGNAFGFLYKTDYVSFLLSMAMIGIALYDGRLTWKGELGLILLDIYMLWLHGKTGFALLFVLICAVLWKHYGKSKEIPFLSKIMLVSFPICFAVNCLLIFTYPLLKLYWNSVPVLGTFKDRLIYGLLAFREYPVTLFGNDMALTHLDRSERSDSLFFALDSSYLNFLLDYGLVWFLLFFGGLTLILLWFYKRNYTLGMFIMSTIALDAVVEHQVFNWCLVVVFLVMCLLYPAGEIIRGSTVPAFARLTRGEKWVVGVISLLLCVILGFWCVTAYAITSRRSLAPEYGATVVVPGGYLSAGVDIVDAAGEYLLSHPDAACIVSTEDERERLTDIGVAGSRIFIADSGSIDELLVSSREIIQSEELPNRLTVCAYSMQLERISRHAESLHIPVNAISVKPDSHYLSLFAGEQWRLLCGD